MFFMVENIKIGLNKFCFGKLNLKEKLAYITSVYCYFFLHLTTYLFLKIFHIFSYVYLFVV